MTEEKYTEEVLDESEELHETAFEEMADGDDPSVEDSDQMALDMGNDRALNIIMLGVYVGYTDVVL